MGAPSGVVLLGHALAERILLVAVLAVLGLERLAAVGRVRALGVAILRGALLLGRRLGVLRVLLGPLRLRLPRHALAECVALVRVGAVLRLERLAARVGVAALLAALLRGVLRGRLALGLRLVRLLRHAGAEVLELRLERLARGIGRPAQVAALLLRFALIGLARLGGRDAGRSSENGDGADGDEQSLHEVASNESVFSLQNDWTVKKLEGHQRIRLGTRGHGRFAVRRFDRSDRARLLRRGPDRAGDGVPRR